MAGGVLGKSLSKAAKGTKAPTMASTFGTVALLAGTQALGLLTTPGPKRVEFDQAFANEASEVRPYSYLVGTNNVVPNLTWYGDFATKKVKNDAAIEDILLAAGVDGLAGYVAGGGTFGLSPTPPTAYEGLALGAVAGAIVEGLGQLRTASFRVYAGWAYTIGHGRIDAVTEVYVDERIVATATELNAGGTLLIDDPQAWGGDHVNGGVYAFCDIVAGDLWPTQQPNPYLKQMLGTVPAFSGKAMFIIRGPQGYTESGYFAAVFDGQPTVRPIRLTVLRLPDLLGVPAFKAINGGKDANIIEVIYDWCTARTRGYGYGGRIPVEKFDLANFQECAETIYNEGLGCSFELKDNISARDALEDMLEFAGGVLYEDNDGLIKIKLIRRDYNIATLPVFNETNIESVEGYTPGTYRDAPNEIRLEYLDRENNFKPRTQIVQNDASKRLLGDTISKTINFVGVVCKETAAIIAARELAASFPRPAIRLIVNSDGETIKFGDPIVWQWSKYNIAQKVLRVAGIRQTDTESNRIELICTEDVYGRGDTITASPADTLWEVPVLSFDVTEYDIPAIVFDAQGDLNQIHGEAGDFVIPAIQFGGAGSVLVGADGSYTIPMIQLDGDGTVVDPVDELLTEGGDRLLLENGDGIELE